MIAPEDYSGVYVTETDKAYLIDFGGEEEVWLPKSQVEFRFNDEETGECTVTMSITLAEEKGII
jgi:hypothetical protein